MVYYHLPGLFEHFEVYFRLIPIFRAEREKFYDNTEIGSVFGSPTMCIWNGGRWSYADAIEWEALDFVREWNLPVGLTFSNCLLEQCHLGDTRCNNILRMFENDTASVMINSPLLEAYIRENYPKYKINASTTRCKGSEAAEELLNYNLTVLDHQYNNDTQFLKNIRHPERVELLCNAVCLPDCQRRKEHYEYISAGIIGTERAGKFDCERVFYPFSLVQQFSPTYISKERMDELVTLGFKNFKFEGRNTHVVDLIEILVYYMAKPQYQMEIRQRLIN